MQYAYQKALIAFLSAGIYVAGYLLMLSSINFFASGNFFDLAAGLLFAWISLVTYAWFLLKSLLPAVLRGSLAFVGGILMSYGFFSDWASV